MFCQSPNIPEQWHKSYIIYRGVNQMVMLSTFLQLSSPPHRHHRLPNLQLWLSWREVVIIPESGMKFGLNFEPSIFLCLLSLHCKAMRLHSHGTSFHCLWLMAKACKGIVLLAFARFSFKRRNAVSGKTAVSLPIMRPFCFHCSSSLGLFCFP